MEAKAKRFGYVVGIDGRRIPIRSPHSALNFLLQSMGAVIMKKTAVILESKIKAAGYIHGVHYGYCSHIHDEQNIEIREDLDADWFGKAAIESLEEAGKELGVRCPITGEYNIGLNWKETH